MKLVSVLSILSVALLLSACGNSENVGEVLDGLSGHQQTRTQGNCKNLSGGYAAGGIATLSIAQAGCESVRIVQECKASYCDFAGIPNVDLSLPLDGSKKEIKGNVYSATLLDNQLTLVKYLGSRTITTQYRYTDHPCTEADAGLEMKTKDNQGAATVETCSVWH